MSFISDFIKSRNDNGEKVLSVFLTSGFPDRKKFTRLALEVIDAGADMLEIGFPFSDPLADGPVIQHSSYKALENGINLKTTFNYIEEIRAKTDKPLILMGYANPVLSYGISSFSKDAVSAGANGVIIPDVPVDEYGKFFDNSFKGLDRILFITPTTSEERIKRIDNKSEGFVYYVSITGTTGKQVSHSKEIMDPLKKAASLVRKNKMLIGFGISSPDDVKTFSPYCSGVIVGSAVIKSLMDEKDNFRNTAKKIRNLKEALSAAAEIQQL